MTDKQIIIDGCDVSKCYRYQKKTGYCEGAFKPEELPFCENFDCEFKRLARKTQECEQKDKELLSNEKIINKLMKEVDELRQECEELKRKLSNQEQLYQNEIEIYNKTCLQLRQENDDLYLERLALNTANSGINALLEVKEQECDRYRKALEEIEEHYEKVVKNLTTCDDSYDANISIEALHNISDIINKAKGEGNGN